MRQQHASNESVPSSPGGDDLTRTADSIDQPETLEREEEASTPIITNPNAG
jgi:hypothetical protein